MNIYPWQQNSWDEIFSDELKMPHAYIFYGAQTQEINKFTSELVKSVLCSKSSKDHFACGVCQNCFWCETNHPDLKIVESSSDIDEKSNSDVLNISNAREVKKFLELTPHQTNGKKIIVVYDAQRLNVAASNALLKSIEEPPNDCLIIFTLNDLANLLPTIASRCRLMPFFKPTINEAKKFLNETNNSNLIDSLQLYNNSPLQLINEKELLATTNTIVNELKRGDKIDLMKINSIWLESGLAWVINLLQKWSYDLLLCKLSEGHSYFPKDVKIVKELAVNADLSRLIIFQKSLNSIKSYAKTTVNKEINLSAVMIEYKKIFIS